MLHWKSIISMDKRLVQNGSSHSLNSTIKSLNISEGRLFIAFGEQNNNWLNIKCQSSAQLLTFIIWYNESLSIDTMGQLVSGDSSISWELSTTHRAGISIGCLRVGMLYSPVLLQRQCFIKTTITKLTAVYLINTHI